MRLVLPLFLALGIWGACTHKAQPKGTHSQNDSLIKLDLQKLRGDALETPDSLQPRPHRAKAYKGSAPLYWQLIHTELHLRLDWAKKEVPGEAWLTVRPYFAPQQVLTLDAKSFQVEEVKLIRPATGRILRQAYDTLKLTLYLDRPYTAQDTLIVYVRYRAQPERLEGESSLAISGRKGAYFINADGREPCKPRQFWTQGEPESASAWFPTLDSPNQKTTQRLCITLEDSLVSLSNGLLVAQKKLPNGLREDCWELNQPHAPYLFALIVGPFQVVKDSWQGKEVSYYLEPGWASEAQAIFGNTPKMIAFFSQKLGVPFPWPKYGQVIVRDFVSGAMENTTAVVHGDMLFYDRSQALTDDHEEVVAHELFHHWFGDLVTCESWAQLPLNESFADYSEYLWLEHSRGVEAAETHRQEAFSTYTSEAREKKVPLIRYDYATPMDMFDAHSYQKGGLTLHLLRKTVGDSAFFLSLKEYLTTNAYKAADIDHLRHAFEKVTGQDWTWFFDQHFHRSDEVRFFIVGEEHGDTAVVKIFQRGYDTLQGPYRYWTRIAVLSQAGYEELPFWLVGDTILTLVRKGLRFVDADPERLFIGQVSRTYPRKWWENLLTDGKYFWARTQALEEIQPYLSGESALLARTLESYRQGGEYWKVHIWEAFTLLADSEAVAQVLSLTREAIKDPSARVRKGAWEFLVGTIQQELTSPQLWRAEMEQALKDSSAAVKGAALIGLFYADSAAALQVARSLTANRSEELALLATALLITRGKDSVAASELLARYPCLLSPSSRVRAMSLLVQAYRDFPGLRPALLEKMRTIAQSENPWYLRLYMVQYLKARLSHNSEVKALLKKIKEEETHPQLKEIYEKML